VRRSYSGARRARARELAAFAALTRPLRRRHCSTLDSDKRQPAPATAAGGGVPKAGGKGGGGDDKQEARSGAGAPAAERRLRGTHC
jgi:hypothetical protein